MNSQPSLQAIQNEVDEFLTAQPSPPARSVVQTNGVPAKRSFSIFDHQDSTRVAELVANFTEKADRAGLDQVVKAAQIAAGIDGMELAQYALMTFIIHHDQGRQLVLPPFWQRHPDLLDRDPNRQPDGTDECPNESDLNWFREDIFLGEHHEHWHAVYGGLGIEEQLNDRHGELFLYMHQQMLARYNTERIAAGLPFVKPFPQKSFKESIKEGYDPGIFGYSARDAGKCLKEDGEVNTRKLDSWSDAINKAIALGVILTECGDEVPIDEDRLGHTIEGNIRATNKEMYGDLHDRIHTMIAMLSHPNLGVMDHSKTSANDPVFFRWHRYIDDISFRFQETQEPNRIDCDMPKVLIRSTQSGIDDASQSPDIIVCLNNQIERYCHSGENFEMLGERLFGAAQEDTPIPERPDITANELFTGMETAVLDLDEPKRQIRIHFLNHAEEYTYFIRVQNQMDEEQTVTARIWLVAKYDHGGRPLYNNRRMWIEMDTFQVTLPASATKVICRPAKFSSVIKKLGGEARKPTFKVRHSDAIHVQENSDSYCDCGWPYSLLLPKGTEQGMAFRLLVMFTGNDIDMQGVENQCGSVSLCGLRKKRYPDKQRMGYPFNRRFPGNKNVEEVIQQQQNMAARDIWIKHLPT